MYWKAPVAVTEQVVVRSVTMTSTVEATVGVPAGSRPGHVGGAVDVIGEVTLS